MLTPWSSGHGGGHWISSTAVRNAVARQIDGVAEASYQATVAHLDIERQIPQSTIGGWADTPGGLEVPHDWGSAAARLEAVSTSLADAATGIGQAGASRLAGALRGAAFATSSLRDDVVGAIEVGVVPHGRPFAARGAAVETAT